MRLGDDMNDDILDSLQKSVVVIGLLVLILLVGLEWI